MMRSISSLAISGLVRYPGKEQERPTFHARNLARPVFRQEQSQAQHERNLALG